MDGTVSMSRLHRRVAGLALAFLIGLGLGAGAASAQQRMITVNGAWLTPEQAALADRNAGFRLPNGHYWLDWNSGLWGVVNGPVVGRLTPEQLAASGGASSGSGGGGGGGDWYHAGPGGWMGSDGGCTYFQGSGGETYTSAGCD